ncbi:MAB_1171c family putative transporter [Kibdelosporangium phytohabitans]|uniref:DUF6545 domain-containing protein n=1 Tax=Kibdelosporangium phytohabitans TaxID=860235 RepID=A0A0N9HXV5_9PSEU|nr:MAB_1171c family putative transporter [Kibdelosporangium phytohabitans]ALG07094.1 hypothetical protein AOZ06_09285 [Kibdelosporangium phytohabitans]MBE1468403.1 hypothetical protein [Kibdelosporangium phytohabitans]
MNGWADWIRLYGPAILAWAFVVGKLVDRRRRAARTGSAIWFILFGLACSLTAMAPAPYRLISEVSGVPNLGRLLSHLSVLLVAVSARILLMRLNETPSVWPARQIWWPATVAVAITVLFVLADTPVDDVRFAGRYAGQPWVLEYWLVFVAGLAPAFVRTIVLCWRYGGLSGTVAGKLGLRAVAVGIACSLLYHVHKALFFGAADIGVAYPKGFGGLLDRMLPLLAAVFVLVGVTLPTWARKLRLPALFGWFGQLRDYHRLRPLWLALYRATPQIALVAPRPALLDLLPTDVDLRLYRRVIEIRDGRLALQPYLDPETGAAARATAAGVTGRQLDALVEASMLAAAMAAKRAGAPARDNELVAVAGGRDLESDTAFLLDVARAYRRRATEAAEPVRGQGVSA